MWDGIGSIFDIASNFSGVIEDSINPGSWIDLFNDGWSLAHMDGAQSNANDALENLQNQIGGLGDQINNIKDIDPRPDPVVDQWNLRPDLTDVGGYRVLVSKHAVPVGFHAADNGLPSGVSSQSTSSGISWALEMVQNINVEDQGTQPREEGDREDEQPAPTQYNAQELHEWARETCNLATGLEYTLHSVHRLVLGDSIGGKPLMELYFKA
ncbi:hypothetical protein BDW74DRAFT_183358 [Aspergillus multicolor]|uniref:uncharacterized protein n=1 Tax=Aspergillus multicolor TaxID=41759 RepID=UPI003CCCD05D